MQNNQLTFKIELNVLKHLGIGLYSSTPSVVTEIIANAWDADANKVSIILDPDNDKIIVEDDGHGMIHDDVQNKFLAVGYSRRTKEASKDMSLSGKRRVMGRKGIGKLAMFSLANNINIVTKAKNKDAVAFSINVKDLLKKAEENSSTGGANYPVQSIEIPSDFTVSHGTRIELTGLNTRINKTESFLRPRLARRFGIFSDSFLVQINNSKITRSNAGYYEHLQFLWHFDEKTRNEIEPLATTLASYKDDVGIIQKCIDAIPSEVAGEPNGLRMGGFIASVDKPSKLGKGDESLNRLTVFANGRLFQEDILPELGDARYFNSYLVGEIHADFLDQDDIDRATASRETIRHDDERFQALRNHLRSVFSIIGDQWDKWRVAQGYENTPDKNPKIEEWINSLKDSRDRKAADRLMTMIGKLNLNNDEAKDAESKKLLYRSAVVGFEKLRSRNELNKLDKISDVLSPEFQAIFASLDEIEASAYLDIVRGRLDIINKFEKEIIDPKKLEKVAQQYLFDHLWLLDPSWDRVVGSEQWELTLTKELKTAYPDTKEGARLDIAYKTTAGRHIIIELKRPGLEVSADDLEKQGRKYVRGMRQYYKDHPDIGGLNGREPAIDVFFLTSKKPDTDAEQERALDAYNLRFMTYEGLIRNAKMAYESYFQVHKDLAGRLGLLLESM